VLDPVRLLIRNLDEAFEGPAWHGPSLLRSLRDVNAGLAGWKPRPGRNSIWQLALHAAYWKYIVRRNVGGAVRRGSFPRKGSNFPALPAEPTQAAWAGDLELLRDQHRKLVEAVATLDPGALEDHPGTSRWTFRQFVLGAAAHDVYHAGQIQLLKKLQRGE
jgi:hypothetical protein